MRDDDRSSRYSRLALNVNKRFKIYVYHFRRDRYNGPTQAFSEKSGYVPNVKLEYIDDLGRNMNEKVT